MITFSLFLFGWCVAHLDSPRFADRDQAERVLVRFWPATVPVVMLADQHPSPEVRSRADRVRWHLSPICRTFAVWFQPWTRTELEALDAILDRHEYDGLPWASRRQHEQGVRPQFLRSLTIVRYRLCLLPDCTLGYETAGWYGTSTIPGLEDLRFAIRGLPSPSSLPYDTELREAAQCQWHDTREHNPIWRKR